MISFGLQPAGLFVARTLRLKISLQNDLPSQPCRQRNAPPRPRPPFQEGCVVSRSCVLRLVVILNFVGQSAFLVRVS